MKSRLITIALLHSTFLNAGDSSFVEAHIKFISTTKLLVGIGIKQANKAEELVIPTDIFSAEIIYRGPARLELIELISVAKQPEKKESTENKEQVSAKRPARGFKEKSRPYDLIASSKLPIAWIDLPTNQGRLNLILLVTPGRDNGITLLQDLPGSFPPGSNRYLNLCAFPIVISAPSGRQTIPAGGTKVIRPGSKNNDYYDLQLMSVMSEEEKLAFSSRVYHTESTRKFFILTPGPGNECRMFVRVIEDRPAPEKRQNLTPNTSKGAK